MIADDDYGIRRILFKALSKIDDVEIVGEAEGGESAISLYEEANPDVVFLDVEMPNINGIECAKKIMDINPKTKVIFVTAHNEYMSDAFELYAFDYLVKPFKLERINQTIERIKNAENESYKLFNKDIENKKSLDKLIIKNKEGIIFIDINNIIIIQRENRSTVIYTLDQNYTTSMSLVEIEKKLERTQFFRSHKSYIINLLMIDKIFPYGRWTYIVKLKNTEIDALLTHDKFLQMQKKF